MENRINKLRASMPLDKFIVIDNVMKTSTLSFFRTLLNDEEILWSPSRSKQAGRNSTYQLANRQIHRTPSMSIIRFLICRSISKVLMQLGFRLPSCTAQIFPVRMRGSTVRPPSQVPHLDSWTRGKSVYYPFLTCIFYITARSINGGNLVGLASRDHAQRVFMVNPRPNRLVLMSGRQWHMVDPLYSGLRNSCVTNFYR